MIQVAHTADFEPATLRAARALLERVFEGDFADSDWEHSLGGMHALAYDGDELVGHASLVHVGSCTAAGRCARATWRAWASAPTVSGAGTPGR